MSSRRTALKLAAGAALGSQFGSALAADGQQTTTTRQGFSDIYLAGATGGQAIPPVDTEARGAAVFAANDEGDGVDYALAVQDVENVTMARIHVSPVGESGPAVAWLYPEDAQEPDPIPGESDGMLATGTIRDADLLGPLEGTSVERLLAGMRGDGIYVSVRTEENPEGEIRGQVLNVLQLFDVLSPGQQAAAPRRDRP